jgi:transposase
MKFVSALPQEQRTALEQLHLNGATARQRQRAHAVLLSADGYPIEQLAGILRADRDTISAWLDAWQKKGLDALTDAPKSGRPRKIDLVLEAELLDLLAHPTPALKAAVQAHIKKKADTSPGTL